MIYLLLLTGLVGLIMPETQAVFVAADHKHLKDAVGTCRPVYSNGEYTYLCYGGCLGETPDDGSCPTFATSNDDTGNPYGVMGDWDVSHVMSMEAMFKDATAFNGDISKWNTGNVANMRFMFFNAGAFNQDLSKWDTVAVSDMHSMFYASGFKQTLCGGAWESLKVDNKLHLQTTGRLGCCPAGSFMSNPMLNPFSVANSCQQCPSGSFSASSDDTDCPYSATMCPAGTYASGTAACLPGLPRLPCLFADEFVGCTDDELQKIKVFYSNRQSC